MAHMAAGMAAPRPNHVARGIVFAALGGICWGFSGTCAQLLTGELGAPVAWITCVRLLLGAAVFLAACLVKNWRSLRAVMRDKRSLLRIAVFALLGVLLTQVSYLSAISLTNAGTGTVLERLGLILIMLYVCLRARRKPKVREAIGLVLAIGGTFLIATKGNIGTLSIPVEGLLWGLVSAFALSCYTLLPGKVLAKWGSFIVTGLAMLLGGVVATLFVQPWTIPVEVTPELVVAMLAMVLVGTFAAYLFYLQGITDAGPVRAGLVGCVEPVSATVISAVWLGTPVLPPDLMGMGMILAMMVLVTQRGEPAQHKGDRFEGSSDDLPPFEGRASLLGYYHARKAVHDDFVRFQEILEDGRATIASLGIDEKGSKTYPSERRVRRAIDWGTAYVVTILEKTPAGEVEHIIGVFAVDPKGDAAYEKSVGAHWLTACSAPSEGAAGYAALHWVTVAREARRRGVGMFILGEAERLAKAAGKASIRCDAYERNEPMRRLLADFGFSSCGTISLHDRLGREKRRAVFERVW